LQQGAVLLAPTRRNYALLATTVESRNAHYGTDDYMVPADELEQEAGGDVGCQFAGGLVMPGAHHVDPAKMIVGLARLARSCGVTICERTEVVGIEREADGFVVESNGGAARARDVVLTTGGYTRSFDRFLWERTLGLPSIAAASEELPADEVSDIFRSGRVILINRFRGYMCRPSPDGRRVMLGGPVGQTPGDTQDNVRALHDYFTKIFPDLKGIEFTHCWTGMIAATRDAQGHSGLHDGTWYSVGASGLVSCADAGRRMAQRILHADAGDDGPFPRWPLRESERLLWRGVEWSSRLLDLVGRSRLR
jgi:glycine/D-amino acid oxidase-like deaminating enzyme